MKRNARVQFVCFFFVCLLKKNIPYFVSFLNILKRNADAAPRLSQRNIAIGSSESRND